MNRSIILAIIVASNFVSSVASATPVRGKSKLTSGMSSIELSKYHNQVLGDIIYASAHVINKYLLVIHTVAVLKACKLNSIATAIEPTTEQEVTIVEKYMGHRQTNGMHAAFAILAGVQASEFYYESGYRAAVALLRPQDRKSACEWATTEANKLMENKPKEK